MRYNQKMKINKKINYVVKDLTIKQGKITLKNEK